MALALLGGGAGAATAQSDEVFVDPDSPAGKEYALPLDSARRDAAGGGGSTARDGAPALFGAGISRRPNAQGEGRDNGGSTGDAVPDERGGSGSGAMGGVDASRSVAKAVAESGSGLSAGALTTVIALGVLLVGGIVGLSLRSLRGRDQPH